MKLKKLLVLVAAMSLMLSITACGSKNNTANGGNNVPAPTTENTPENTTEPAPVDTALVPEEGAELYIWDSKDEIKFTNEIVKRFEEKYGVKVKIEELAPTDQVGRLTTDGPSGLAADVLIVPHDHLGNAANSGLVLANDVFAEETTKNNTEASIVASTYDGVLYGYPRAAETYALFYNKSLVPTPPTSFEEVIEFAKTFNDTKKKKYALMWEAGNLYFNYPFIATGGGYLFGDNGTNKDDIGVAKDGAIEGLKVFQSLNAILPIKTGDINPDIKRGLFGTGDVAMDINGPWEVAGYKEALGDNLAIAPIPTINGKTAISFSGMKIYVVNSFTKYPNASKLFAEFASSKEAQLLLNETVGSVPTNLEALESDQIKNDPIVSGFAVQAANSQPMPSIPEIGNTWAPMGAAFTEIWNNNADPKATMDNALKQITDLNNGVTAE